MPYTDLRDFIQLLETNGELKRISMPVDPRLEITEICHRTLLNAGPALLFENPINFSMPLLANLFGTTKRVAMGMGKNSLEELRELGELLAYLKEPEPPKGLRDAWDKWPMLKQVFNMSPKQAQHGLCQTVVLEGSQINLQEFPIQTCWPLDIAPLITWGLVVTKNQQRINCGIYRQQVIAPNKVIMRWLAHRGGSLDFLAWQKQRPNEPFPIAVVLGADPATTLAAVTPIPDKLSEYAFAGLLRGSKTELVRCISNDLTVPATAEIILEGYIMPGEMAEEGPFGDHTGYYNEVEKFPVMTITHITHRKNPLYHSTYTGRPPDEPAILGMALNEIIVPLLKKQFPEIQDFYLPPEGCSYRLALVSIKKSYPGHAKRILFGVWSYLTQFMYTKFVIVVDDDINIRQWSDVIWAISTRMDPARDTVMVENTPIDYLDFASPISGLGSKMGFDATNKMSGETSRIWGQPIIQDPTIIKKIDSIWDQLGIFS